MVQRISGASETIQVPRAHLISYCCLDAGREVDGRHIVVQFAKYGRKDEPM